MNEADLPPDSETSDDDYCPSGDENVAASEEDESGEDEDRDRQSEGDDVDQGRPKKTKENKRRKQKPGRKSNGLKRKATKGRKEEDEQGEESEEEPEAKKPCPEEEKKKADSLWADFLKDTGGRVESKKTELKSECSPAAGTPETKNRNREPSKEQTTEEKENKVTVTQIFEFAGEKISIEKEVPSESVKEPVQGGPVGMRGTGRGRGRGSYCGRGGGSSALTGFIGQLGKKGKLNMLEKSKLDWDQFKKKEGIEEDLQTHNKGKAGYLERQDFLQRADLRQFEIEKGFRAKRSGR